MSQNLAERENSGFTYMNKVSDYEWDPASRENVKFEATIEILRHGRGWREEDK